MMIRKAVFPAAGLGTRFLPATKNQPKEMLPIYNKPAIQYVIEEAVAAGLEEILIIIGRGKHSIVEHFDRNPELEAFLEKKGKPELVRMVKEISDLARLHFVHQKEALGLGHAVLTAEAFVGNEPFAVFLADDIVAPPFCASHGVKSTLCSPDVAPSDDGPNAIGQMIEVFKKTGSSVIALEAVAEEKVQDYGVIAGEKVGERLHRVTRLVEKPPPGTAPSNLTIVGRYLFTPGIFPLLRETKAGRGGEIQLTDAMARLLASEPIHGLELLGRRYDTGDPAGFLEATLDYALRSQDRERVQQYLDRIR
jgi:UTP--glucose-1-phosphate uridylyltransferase